MGNLALIDLIRPYFFIGVDLGDEIDGILELLFVDEYEEAWDDEGIVIYGVARVADESSGTLGFSLGSGGNSLEIDPADITVDFRLSVARRPAASLAGATLTDGDLRAALGALGPSTGGPSDYPGTQFRLELLFNLITLTFPGLLGAKPDGAFLAPDPANPEVKFDLPRITLQVVQDSAADTAADAGVTSWGAETLDEPDEEVASLFRMRPPHALFDGEQFGIGVEKAVLDLSERHTPPDLLDRFGLGDDFTGLHVPEFRFYFSPGDAVGYEGNVGASDLIIGFKPEPAIWGDLSFDMDFHGDRLRCDLQLIDAASRRVTVMVVPLESDDLPEYRRFRAEIPSNARPETENFLLMVDVFTGSPRYTITAAHALDHGDFDAHNASLADLDAFIDADPNDISALQRMRLFAHDQQVIVRVVDREDHRQYLVLDLVAVAERDESSDDPNERALEVHLEPPSERVRIVDQSDPNAVTVRLTPPNGAIAGTTVTGGRATIPIGPGESRPLEVTWPPEPAVGPGTLTAYFRHAEPGNGRTGTGETTATASMSGTPQRGGPATPLDIAGFRRHWQSQVDAGESPRIRVDSYASTEDGRANIAYNRRLAADRAEALATVLRREFPGVAIETHAWGEDDHPLLHDTGDLGRDYFSGQTPTDGTALGASGTEDDTGRFGQPAGTYEAEAFRSATASFVRTVPSEEPYSGTLTRDPAEPPEVPRGDDIQPPHSQRPEWLQSIGATVRWEREPIPIAAELRGTIDFQTAHEDTLDQYRGDLNVIGPGLEAPERERLPALDSQPNADNGVVDFRITITHDPSTATFTETLVARAGEEDRDGLWSWGEIPADADATPNDDPWRDLAGLYFALAPLTASTAQDTANGGDVVPLVVSLATPIVVTALGIAHVDRFTHYGIELGITHDEDEVHAVLLFDVESAIRLNFKLGDFVIATTEVDKPIKVRYRAIGFGLDVAPDGTPAFQPVFDSSRGYTLDLADSGSLKILPSLGEAIGDIIQVLGATIARTNPLNIEVDLGLGVDLGVFSVDRFGFRLPVDPLEAPTITALGIGVDIPDTLVGHGYLQILKTGFAGQLDLALPSVGLRVAAGVKVETVSDGDRSATGVLATIEVEFPGGIPLGGTGMAIFGFLGLFAMHHARDENTSARNPALDWLDTRVHGNPTDIRGWTGELDAWAFGLGVVAGTIEGGTILNIKGMLVVELPGPRILLFVKAQLLTAKPPTRGESTGNLLAVVDIGPAGIMIGIQIQYEIEEILNIQIPIEAGFPFKNPENFYVDIGSIAVPIRATVLELFHATAYFMVHGNGIDDFPLFRDGLQGFSIATGFQVSISWGAEDIGLYLRVAAGFDVGIGFAPFSFGGRLYLEGALHLIIVAIEASAALTVKAAEMETIPGEPESTALVTYIHGEVCGRVSLLFFTIEACVEFSLGNDPDEPPPPRPIRDLTLQSRSPALAEGSAVDRGVDTVLCRGTEGERGTVPVVDGGDGPREVFVPIDAIPLLQFEAAPVMDDSAVDGTVQGAPLPGEDGWQKRGMVYVRYHVREIELRLVAQHGVLVAAGTAPTTEGPRPYTWRIGADDGSGDGLPVDLAMLDWKPTNTDKAILEGDALDGIVEGTWGEACVPVAAPASVLWTFRDEPLGPSATGWGLDGEAWPDAAGTRRSRPVETGVRVTETWRTGTPLDGLLPHKPAEVVGGPVECPSKELRRIAEDGGQDLCVSKVLEAPYELLAASLDPEVLDSGLGEVVIEADKVRAEALRDVIRISGGPHNELTLLVVADEKLVDSGLMDAAAFDAAGGDLGPVEVSFKRVAADGDLPRRWTDGRGPWWDEVRLARGFAAGASRKAEFIVHLKPSRPAFHIDLGIRPLQDALEKFGLVAPSWFLVAFEGLSDRESRRHDAESDLHTANETALADSLASDPHALLLPDAEYQVVVHYTGQTGRKPADGEPGDPNEIEVKWTTEPLTDKRTFFTDAAAPSNLEPWTLAQFPAPDEPHHFHDDPVVFVFATDDVLELYSAYDRTLRAVARAASFRGSAGTPDAPWTRIDLAGLFERKEGLVLSPFEATARRLLADRPCHDYDPAADRHGRAVVDFRLDPITEYVIDIEALDPAGEPAVPVRPAEAVGDRPLYRQRMTTSRYANRDEFARAVRESRIAYRRLDDPAPLTALTGTVGDDEFDRALAAAGLEPRPRPVSPEITVLWSPDATATPVAIYIETPEPLWRDRLEPEPVYAEDGVHIAQWRLERKPWLLVDELLPATAVPVSEGGDFLRPGYVTKETFAPSIGELRERFLRHLPVPPKPVPPAAARVARFARDSSGARTLAFLKPGARGSTVTLGLARDLHPLLDLDTADTAALLGEITLTGPVWELP